MKKITVFLLVLFLANFIGVNAQESNTPTLSAKFGKGLTVTTANKDFSITIRGRFQSLIQLEHNKNVDKAAFGAQVRRARLKISGYVFEGKKIEYAVQIGFTHKDISAIDEGKGLLLDAILKYNVHKNFSIWFGQTKLPGNREGLISSQKQQFVDRSETSGFKLDRDFGVHLRAKVGENVVFKPVFAVSLGEGRNISSMDVGGLAYTFKAELLPLGDFTKKGDYVGGDLSREETPKLAFAVVYDLNHNAKFSKGHRGGNEIAIADRTSIHTVFADALFKYKGISIFTEFSREMVDDANAYRTDYTTGNAVTASAGYVCKKNWEVAARFSRMMPLDVLDVDKSLRSAENNYTIALSKYFLGHNLKIQTDYTITDDINDPTPVDGLWRFQVEVAF